MKTFEELKERTTPDIIKKMVEFAERFELSYFDGHGDIVIYPYNKALPLSVIYDNGIVFSTLLHRVVEGWNKINPCKPIQILCNCISFITDEDDPASVEWGYDNEQYKPCHLTQCELAIWDCLLNIL